MGLLKVLRYFPEIFLLEDLDIFPKLHHIFSMSSMSSARQFILFSYQVLPCSVSGAMSEEQVTALELYFENVRDQEDASVYRTWYGRR